MYVLINKTKKYEKYCILFWCPKTEVENTKYKWVLLDDFIEELKLSWNQKKTEKNVEKIEKNKNELNNFIVLGFNSFNLAETFLKDIENNGIKNRIDRKIVIQEALYNNKGKYMLSCLLDDEIDLDDVEIVEM